MKIEASSLTFSASHRETMRTEMTETLRAWTGDQRPDFGDEATPRPLVAISDAARLAAQLAVPDPLPAAPDTAQAIDDIAHRTEHDPVLVFIKLVVEILTGVKVKTVSMDDMRGTDAPPKLPDAAPVPPRAGFGIEYDRHEVHEESEITRFRADGVIRTTDGKEIHLDVALSMQRTYREESNVSVRAGDGVRKDPLVINFDGSAAQLQNIRFQFDIDGDGSKEAVPLLSGNRGYLALDLNHNGKVDSGMELFGALSGDGFAELAQYDSDDNGWIDDNDPIFSELRVWMQDGKGEGTLALAKAHGVGALYLGRTETPFAIKGDNNQELGGVRSSGVYLTEKGSAGTLQQIDLMV